VLKEQGLKEDILRWYRYLYVLIFTGDLVAFDEVAPIFIGAQNLPVLSTVKWFGSDDSVLNHKLVKNMDAALFAVKTGFVNPIYAVDNKSYKLKLIDNQRFKRW
jgi:hypothetical protein